MRYDIDGGINIVSKTVAFDGTAGKGAIGSVPLFTVTGQVLIVAIVPFCTEETVATTGATISLGVTGDLVLFIGATNETNFYINSFWVQTTGAIENGLALPAALKDVIITKNLVANVLVANITDGTIRFDLFWIPLSSDGSVVAA